MVLSSFNYFCTIYLCIGVFNVWAEDGRESRVVRTAQGPVRGYKDPETGLFSFMSIPYATPPTGPNKFKAPLPAPVWKQPLEAVDKRIICPQASFPMMPIDSNMQEDCLIANVFVPDTEETNLPVYVDVHGGGFQVGYGEWTKPTTMLTENNIIAVTFNYRLGVHGFLCLGTEDVPGNAGMKDQVALLRWVKKNIASFGGNPNDVTIGGCSAGGASVDLLLLSKSTEGLFNKAIPQSGASVGVFSIQKNPLENAQWYANFVNFTETDDIYALEEFYKTAPFETLTTTTFFGQKQDSTLPFVPCVERPTEEELFLDDHPVNILKKGNYRKVPLLYGFSQMEGLSLIYSFDTSKDLMNEKFSDFFPGDLQFPSESEKAEVAKSVKEFYFGEKPISEDSILGFIEYFGDIMFVYPHLRSVGLQVDDGHDQIYLYEYSFVDESDPIIPHTTVRGASHCFQSIAVCDGRMAMPSGPQVPRTEEYIHMSSIMKQFWANFIKTGKPVPEGSPLPAWPPVQGNGAPHMSLGVEVRLEGSLAERRVAFWENIYEKYYSEPVPPPSPPSKATKHAEL